MQESKALCFKVLIFPAKKKKKERNKQTTHTHTPQQKKHYKELSSNTINGQKIDFLSNKFSTGITLLVHT